MYNFDWIDGDTEWTEYSDSGAEFTLKHTWTSQSTFTIKAQAVDFYGVESDWSEFKIEIPRPKVITYLWFHWFIESFPLLEKLLSFVIEI